MHQPLVQGPTSTMVPLGMSVMISLSVPGPFLRFTSEVTMAGFAAARSVDRIVRIAALAASRARFMTALVLLCEGAPRRHLTRRAGSDSIGIPIGALHGPARWRPFGAIGRRPPSKRHEKPRSRTPMSVE